VTLNFDLSSLKSAKWLLLAWGSFTQDFYAFLAFELGNHVRPMNRQTTRCTMRSIMMSGVVNALST